MRYYPADWLWFSRLLEKLALSDIPLTVRHAGDIALLSARWGVGAEEMDSPDNAVIANCDGSLIDMGHTENVLRLMSGNFTLRYFNRLRMGRTGYFLKSSTDVQKVRAEHEFLSSLPAAVRPFFPAVGAKSDDGYEIEIIPAFDVATLLLSRRFASQESAAELMKALEAYRDACPVKTCRPHEYAATMRALFLDKTRERLETLARLPVSVNLDMACRSNGFDSLGHFAAEHFALMEKSIAGESGSSLVFSHGDLFFSNILFDPLAGKIKLIDPKGGNAAGGMFLPAWYDIAKLSHSFLGRYDLLAHNEFSVRMADDLSWKAYAADMPGSSLLEARFLDFLNRKGIELWKTRLFECALFLSMLPLHADFPLRVCALLLQALDIHRRLTTPGSALYGSDTK
jgi:hypothetical protein